MSGLFSVEGRVALVTGGTSGIGRMIARGLVEAGARVYVVSRKAQACEEMAASLEDLPGECIGFPADLSGDGVEEVGKLIEESEEALDILVNSAGATWGAPLAEYPDKGFEKVVHLNLTAIFSLTRRLADSLRARSTADQPARVINIGSVEGLVVPEWENYAYPASKAGIHMLTRQLARHLAPEITVNAIAPGPFPSRMLSFAQEDEENWQKLMNSVPLQRAGEGEDIAGAVIYLASRAGAYVTGTVLSVDGGLAGAGRLGR